MTDTAEETETARRGPQPARVIAVVAALAVTLGVVWFLVTSFEADPPTRDQLIDAYRSAGMAEEQAACSADAVLDNFSDHEVSMIVERGPSGAPVDDPAVPDEPIDQVRAALTACQLISPSTSEPADVTTTTVAGSVPTTEAASFDTVATTAP